MAGLRSLPPMPESIARLPVAANGYPVPYFVAWIDGKPDFRVVDAKKQAHAVMDHRCLICGEPLQQELAFSIGPMCAVNRISAEAPSHPDCAVWSAQACPFLSRPHMVRRREGLPESSEKPAGTMIERNPGVALVWVTDDYRLIQVENGVLFEMSAPQRVLTFTEGRPATQEEVQRALVEGLPLLFNAAVQDGPSALAELARCLNRAIGDLGLPYQDVRQIIREQRDDAVLTAILAFRGSQ